MNIKVLGVCGGNGLILHPFKQDLLGNIEPRSVFKTPHEIQWRLNFGKIPIYRTTELIECKPDVIIGAPDCGHSSVLAYSRAKKLSDPKENVSLTFFIKSIHHYKPKAFKMENLPKLLDNIDLPSTFSGYRLIIHCESVSSWGNSQKSRKRLVVIGIRSDQADFPLNVFKKLGKHKELPKSGDLVRGLKKEDETLCNVRELPNTSVCLYYQDRRNITAREARKLWLTEFKEYRKWPLKGHKMKNQPGCYRNFKHDYPMTVRKQNRQFNHWGLMLSPREMARIQGVPDEFKLWFNESQRNYSINKARTTIAKSPPYELGAWFYSKLSKYEHHFC